MPEFTSQASTPTERTEADTQYLRSVATRLQRQVSKLSVVLLALGEYDTRATWDHLSRWTRDPLDFQSGKASVRGLLIADNDCLETTGRPSFGLHRAKLTRCIDELSKGDPSEA